MSPGDFNEKEAMELAANELTSILNDCFSCMTWELIPNPYRKKWQFWKPKFIAKRIEGKS